MQEEKEFKKCTQNLLLVSLGGVDWSYRCILPLLLALRMPVKSIINFILMIAIIKRTFVETTLQQAIHNQTPPCSWNGKQSYSKDSTRLSTKHSPKINIILQRQSDLNV